MLLALAVVGCAAASGQRAFWHDEGDAAADVEPSRPAEEDRPMGIGSSPPAGALILFAGDNADAWERADGSRPIDWPINDGALVVHPGRGDVQTVGAFNDFQ